MPVVEKIESLKIKGHNPSVTIGGNFIVSLWNTDTDRFDHIVSLCEVSPNKETKKERIENTFNGVVKFIKWYNEQKK
jgi:hypothetical protein